MASYRLLDVGEPPVFAHGCDWEGRVVIALHNFSDRPRTSTFKRARRGGRSKSPTSGDDQTYPAVEDSARVGPYGYRWLRVIKKGQELLL